jgi:hypothetical protein
LRQATENFLGRRKNYDTLDKRKAAVACLAERGIHNVNTPNDSKKAVVVDSDHCDAGNHDADWVWKNLFRGNQFILMDGYVDDRIGAPPKPDPKWDATRQAMGRARAFAERIDLAMLMPRPELASTSYCLANLPKGKVEYAAYLLEGGEAALDLTAATGPLAVEWIAPRTGETRADAPVAGGLSPRSLARQSRGCGPRTRRLRMCRGKVRI